MRLTRPADRRADCDHDPNRAWSHTWTDDGRRICWQPECDKPFAVDAERHDQPVPAALAARFGLAGREFWVAWTRAEVIAKLRDQPILALLDHEGLTPRIPATWRIRTTDVTDITVSYGVALRKAPSVK